MDDITLRKINIKDLLLIYKWFNDKDSIQFKIKTKNKIMFKDHKIWYREFFKKKAGEFVSIGMIKTRKERSLI